MQYVLLFLLLCGCGMQTEAQEKGLSFSIHLTHTERSRDSYSIYQSWAVKDENLAYHKNFGGKLKMREAEKWAGKLTNEQIQAVLALLDETLLQNIDAPKQSEFNPPYSATRLTWQITHKDKNYRIELYGIESEMRQNPIYQKIQKITGILPTK